MTGTEIFIIVIFLILLLVGLGIGIYFVWKYEKDKNNPTPGPMGPPVPPAPPGPSGASGASGPFIPGNFSISPVVNPNVFLSYSPGDGGSPLPVITSATTSTKCNSYSWQNIANFKGLSTPDVISSALVSNGTTNLGGYLPPPNLTNGVNILAGGQAILSNDTTPAPSVVLNWTYNPSAKTWCGTDIYTEYCLYFNGSTGNLNDSPVTVEEIGRSGITLQAQNFQWNNVTPITSPKCTP